MTTGATALSEPPLSVRDQVRPERPRLDIIIPVHNEEGSIEASLRELCQVLATDGRCTFRLIVCEDGSSDKSLEILETLSTEMPIKLVTGRRRKGYARAVADGLRAANADYLAVFEGDGQTDPRGIKILLDQIGPVDLIVGWRNPRSDTLFRKALSRGFRVVYRRLFAVALTDPSYACILIRGPALQRVLPLMKNRLSEGFFWEFNAWCHALDLAIAESPVPHRNRRVGKTRVYRLSKLAGIAFRQVIGLFRLRRDIAVARPGLKLERTLSEREVVGEENRPLAV